MNLEIDEKIFNWLVDLKVLRDMSCYKTLPNGRIALNEKTTIGFETGHGFMKILE